MNWLKRLVKWFKSLFVKADESAQPKVVSADEPRYHCVRIFRKEGDELIMLLTEEEMENGIRRAVERIGVVPYSE
jgi:hypothetical protein